MLTSPWFLPVGEGVLYLEYTQNNCLNTKKINQSIILLLYVWCWSLNICILFITDVFGQADLNAAGLTSQQAWQFKGQWKTIHVDSKTKNPTE